MNEDEKKLGLLEKIKTRTLDVIKEKKLGSWVQVVMKMKESPKEEWDALPSLGMINQVIFTLEEKLKRQWESLPSTALLNIFCNTELKDRVESIPLVCKSWKYVTDDPRCWYSMIPDSVSPEDAFIKNTSGYKFKTYSLNRKAYAAMKNNLERDNYNFLDGLSRLFKEEGDLDQEEENEQGEVLDGLLRLRDLIKKSGGGAAITTLYLKPFATYCHVSNYCIYPIYDDEMIHLIANCCPNLKHISLNTVLKVPMKALLRLINKCKKLELVDLSNSFIEDVDHADQYAPLVLQEMGKCLPNLRGIRINISGDPYAIGVSIATYLPQLKLLSINSDQVFEEHLANVLFGCRELQYLYVKRIWKLSQDIRDQGSQIPDFIYATPRCYCESVCCTCNWSNHYVGVYDWTEHIVNRDNDYEDHESKETCDFRMDDDFRIDDYRDILKQRKEDGYVSILKEKMKRKKNNHCNSSLIKKKKKKKSTLKKNQCAYVDYVEEYRWLLGYGKDIVSY